MADDKSDDPTTKQMLDAVPGLRLADREWRAIASMRHPAKVALWLALMKPAHEVLERAKEGWKPVGEGEDPEVVPESERREPVPSIIALGEAMLARALSGDPSAASQILDRIEGKVGQRSGDVDPAVEASREVVTATIEAIVRGFTNQKLGKAVDVEILGETDIVSDRKREDTERPTKKPNGKINGH
jgi:hypothetical protein